MDPLQLYTAAEVADLLKMNHQVVQRKLQAGEIPAYRIGREWRVEHSKLVEWLEAHSNQRPRSPDEQVRAAYRGPDGRLTKIPDKRGKREIVLREIADEFQPNRTYAEREVNAILRRHHDDVAWMRRELVSMKLLSRTPEGVYRRATSAASAARRRA